MTSPRALGALAAALAALAASPLLAAPAAEGARPALLDRPTLEQVMAHPDWMGPAPRSPYWADDDASIYFERKLPGTEERELLELKTEGGEPRRVLDSERGAADARGGAWDRNRKRKAWTRAGDLFMRESTGSPPVQLTRTAEAESSPQWLLDGRLSWRRGERLFARDFATGLVEELAELRFEKEPGSDDDASWLAEQNERLFEHLRTRRERREEKRKRDTERRTADPTRAKAPWFLGKKNERRRADLSPTGRRLLVTIAPSKREEGRRDLMPTWITEDGYVSERKVRPKVGTTERAQDRLVLLDLEAGLRHELDLSGLPGIADDPLASLRAQAKRRAAEKRRAARDADDEAEAKDSGGSRKSDERPGRAGGEGKPRPVTVLSAEWSEDGERAWVLLRSHDNKDRWLVVVEADGRVRPVHRLHDPAWINWSFNEAGWFPDGKRLWFLSEESGWSNLFVHELERGRTRALVEGRQVVSRPRLSRDGKTVWFRSNPRHPGIREIFRVDVDSGRTEQLTTLGGLNDFVLSNDEQELLLVHSETTRPNELWLQAAVPGAAARPLTDSRSEAFRSIAWTAPRHVTVESRHGAGRIHARLYEPAGPSPPEGRPAVVFIHGAGYLQDAHQGWSGYFREFMFHSLLVDRGFVVLDMDWRGSAGYGRAWRTAVYRDMGGPELEDLRDGVDWLAAHAGVDRDRVGCYGGSYGGFLTFMALFKEPDLFAAGAALRPVSDWAHYNHGYTSNILNTPELDPEAFSRSSPIEHAAGLSKPLLICAPMLDDNVLFLDVVRLVQRLIELGKTEHFETAIYPVESHGFREPASWLDEYRRILKLFETHLR